MDFEVVNQRLQTLPDPSVRRTLLPVLRSAPKWDAPAYFLQALRDPHQEGREVASVLMDEWLTSFNRSQARPGPDQYDGVMNYLTSPPFGYRPTQ